MMRSALAANWHACVPFRAVTGDLRCPRPAAVVGRSGRSGVCFRSVIESMEKRARAVSESALVLAGRRHPPGLSAVVLTPPWTMAEEEVDLQSLPSLLVSRTDQALCPDDTTARTVGPLGALCSKVGGVGRPSRRLRGGRRSPWTTPAAARLRSTYQVRSSSHQKNPCRADVGRRWWLLCHPSPNVTTAISASCRSNQRSRSGVDPRRARAS